MVRRRDALRTALEHGEWARHFQSGAWCGSGLLRRLAVLYTVVPADAVTGYQGLPIRATKDWAQCAGVWTSATERASATASRT
ncbi:hypothetical protein GCM10017744_103510 [Streptomyces antimycoticus]